MWTDERIDHLQCVLLHERGLVMSVQTENMLRWWCVGQQALLRTEKPTRIWNHVFKTDIQNQLRTLNSKKKHDKKLKMSAPKGFQCGSPALHAPLSSSLVVMQDFLFTDIIPSRNIPTKLTNLIKLYLCFWVLGIMWHITPTSAEFKAFLYAHYWDTCPNEKQIRWGWGC